MNIIMDLRHTIWAVLCSSVIGFVIGIAFKCLFDNVANKIKKIIKRKIRGDK